VIRPTAAASGVVSAAVEAAVVATPYKLLLQEFPDVVCPSGELPPVKHEVQHFIETDGQPVAAKYRHLDPVKLAAAQKEFAQLENKVLFGGQTPAGRHLSTWCRNRMAAGDHVVTTDTLISKPNWTDILAPILGT
jgi:hypothetical protein